MKHVIVIFSLVFLNVLAQTSTARAISESGIDDQVTVSVTVYNSNLGLVKDTRNVTLPRGTGELRFMDVAALIMPETVHVKSIHHPEAFSVLEQNYEYDLIDADKLLDKYVGKTIKIVDWNPFKDRKAVVEARLLSNNQGQIYEIDKEIYLGHPGYKVLPKIPENLIAKPTLTWLVDSTINQPHQLEVSYLTQNINWKADYVLVLNAADTRGDLTGWVTLGNKSGATYKDARLKLVAGDVNRVRDQPESQGMVYAANARTKAAAPQFKEASFFEYHIYDLQRKTTIKDRQTKQVQLLKALGAGMEKELLVYGAKTWFTRKYTEQRPKQPVNVYVTFQNTRENSLGMPLPAGVMRLYKHDNAGSLQFIGEDRIRHTPKDETVSLKIGEAFDVVAERVQTDYRRITTMLHESEWEITLKNHKETPVSVGVVEPLYGNWQVVSNSHPYGKKDAFTIRFDVNVPKDGEVKITYRIRVGL